MQKTYRIQYYVRDVEKHQSRVQPDDLRESLWDIISDAVDTENPRDQMSMSNADFARALYDAAEFDEHGFCAIVGDVMITANEE